MDFGAHSFSPESLSALAQASAAINSTLDLNRVLDQIAVSTAEVMRAEASSVLTYDRRRNKLVFSAAVGARKEELLGREFDAELGIAGHVLETAEAVNVGDVSRHPHFFDGIDRFSHFETRGLIAAPMIDKKEIIGVVEAVNRREGGAFDEGDVELLRVFANLAACGVRNAQQHENLRRENQALRGSVMVSQPIVGSAKALRDTLELADRVAPTTATVLLVGETGTGKEVLAKYIHNQSPRANRAFVAVNCAALPETLLESELFGHEKGAFTGAISRRIGRFELADNGTLFLDEIGDISPSTQVRLLRLLQERTFTRVGGAQTIACDVRIMAATNRDLKKAIAAGTFRNDLFYRLNVFPITMPPLRDRSDDVAALSQHFMRMAATDLGVGVRHITPEAQALLTAYSWPGNIRELANVIERAVLLSDGSELTAAQLPVEITAGDARLVATPGDPQLRAGDLRGQERAMIVRALLDQQWNQSAAARSLGISRDNLRYRIRKYQIKRDEG